MAVQVTRFEDKTPVIASEAKQSLPLYLGRLCPLVIAKVSHKQASAVSWISWENYLRIFQPLAVVLMLVGDFYDYLETKPTST